MSKQRLAFVDQQNTRWRGETKTGHLDWEMFPGRLEGMTGIDNLSMGDVDPLMVEDFQRTVIKDWGPDAPTHESERPRRRFESEARINLRSGARVLTDPYANPEFSTMDMTKDPRGWTGELRWDEMRRHNNNRLKWRDFKDDSDNSIPSDGVHPNDKYRNIVAVRKWIRSKFKVFDTSSTAYQTGGIGNLRRTHSEVPMVTHEEEPGHLERRAFEEASRVNNTIIASNQFHHGSKYFKTNMTTDHKIKVASYGKLLGRGGLIPHRSQVAQAVNEQPIKTMRKRGMNRGLLKFITANKRRDTTKEDNPHKVERMSNTNRTLKRDIMSLLGFTEQDVEHIQRSSNMNRSMKDTVMANIVDLTEALDQLSHNEMMQLKKELIYAGAGLIPGEAYKNRRRVRINPVAVLAMQQRGRSRQLIGTTERRADVDPEGVLKNVINKGAMYVAKRGAIKDEQDTVALTDLDQELEDGAKVHTYTGLKMSNMVKNQRMADSNVYHADVVKNIAKRARQLREPTAAEHAEDIERDDNRFFDYTLTTWADSHNKNSGKTRQMGETGHYQSEEMVQNN